MFKGFASVIQAIISGFAFGLAHARWTLPAKRDIKFSLPASYFKSEASGTQTAQPESLYR